MSSVIVTLKSTTPTLAEVEASANEAGLSAHIVDLVTIDVFSLNQEEIDSWVNQNKDNDGLQLKISPIEMAPRLSLTSSEVDVATFNPNSRDVPYFWMNEIAAIYGIPAPNPDTKVVVGVVSFGGGLFGSVDADGVLTDSDCSKYWSDIGITPPNHPRVIVKPIYGTTNSPDDGIATVENTLDVETIGGACPSANLTIILYISPNRLDVGPNMLRYIYSEPVVVGGDSYKPTIVSVSWSAPEIYFGRSLVTSTNAQLAAMTATGMNILVATGDNGSNDGVAGGGNYVGFPSSSPHATAVGGTSLTCPNNRYDNFTSEHGWSGSGGGVSSLNSKPAYQSEITATGRSTPDVAAVADPRTGVFYFINGTYQHWGGTSVAAPIIAAFLAAIDCNSFVNPKIYAADASCFHDVTTGSNGGFSASSGYDNCTGLGTINGYNLAAALSRIIATSISLSPTTLILPIGQTATLTHTILPVNVSISAVTWTSGKPLIASVNDGLVTGVAVGSTTISVATADGSNLRTSVPITVTNVRVTRVTLNKSSVRLHPTNTTQLVATVAPANARRQTVSWSSSNTAVAAVDQDGLVNALTRGLATVTVTTTDGNKQASALISVTVPVASVTVIPDLLSLRVGQSKSLTTIVLPTSAGDRSVAWATGNASVATVSSNGLAAGVGNGTTSITATTSDMGFQASAIVTVYTTVRSVAISPSSTLKLSIGQTQSLAAIIAPATASNKTVTWTSTNKRVATVDQSGNVTAIGNGSCSVYVATQDGNRQASVFVRVIENRVTGVSLNVTTTLLPRGLYYTLLATVSPTNATDKTVSWSTDNQNVATVYSRGSVTGVGSGTATITVTTSDGNFTDTCIVTVP